MNRTQRSLPVVACLFVWSHTGTTLSLAQDASSILGASGVKGGLVLHLGCDQGKLTAALRAGDSYLVHGLDTDPVKVQTARRYLRERGLLGPVQAARYDGAHLPFIDSCANVIVVSDPARVPRSELERVVAPGGVVVTAGAGTPKVQRQPVPGAIDQWTHYLHGPDNNAVSHDALVEQPYHAQWIGAPKWARHHNYLASTSGMVTANGRVFAIVDEGSPASLARPAQWRLVARDAFSGVLLWTKPIGDWEGVLRPFRSGPTELPRRLVAVGDRVYVTLAYGAPVTALDAATGEVIQTFAETTDALELLVDKGVLYVVVGTMDQQADAAARLRGAPSPAPHNKALLAVDAASGRMLWRKHDADTRELLPTTLCVGEGHVFFQGVTHLVCLDSASGQPRWRAPRPVATKRLGWSAPTVVVRDGVVLSADRAPEETPSPPEAEVQWKPSSAPARTVPAEGELIAFSATDGKELWRCPTALGYNSPPDVFVTGGLVWTGAVPSRTQPDFTQGRALHTGEVKRTLNTAAVFEVAHHHRCYRDKATDRFLVLGRTGVEWVDLNHPEAKPLRHCWIRGGCQYGVMPANGLLYCPPHSCACYIQSKLSGFWAVAPKRPTPPPRTELRRLEQGPAYGAAPAASTPPQRSPSPDWPTFRHDAARTGASSMAAPSRPKTAWTADLGGKLTAPVAAEGKVLVADTDAHTVHALDADTGKHAWSFFAGGRVDSPPTVYSGAAFFGCADGYVYCLRLSDGELAWRFRVAPTDQRLVCFNQVESVWPVTGSVLVRSGVVYCTAGRSSFLDGGMYLRRLDAATGKLLGEKRFDSRDPLTGAQPESTIEDVELPGALPEVLVADENNLYLRDKVMDFEGNERHTYVPHLYCSAGLLDDNWWHRTYWLWGERTWGRASGWGVIPKYRPSGRILATDEKTVFGYGRRKVNGNDLSGYHLFRADKQVTEIDKPIKNNNAALTKYQRPAKVKEYWSREISLVGRALVLAGETLYVAGPKLTSAGGLDEPAFAGEAPAALLAVRADDGQELVSLTLPAQPVFDGLIAARGKLYLSDVAGRLTCFAGE